MQDENMGELRKFVSPEFITGINSRIFAGRYAKNFRAGKVLLAVDPNISSIWWMDEIMQSLDEEGVEYTEFSGITENPKAYEVMKGAELFRQNKCDGIVAVGGGSTLDCAKGIGIVAANGGDITEYIGVDLVSSPMPPLICIPTTAGSSADVSQYAVISDHNYKKLIISKSVVPDVSLLDPQTLTTQPEEVTYGSGIDALFHAVEAFCSNGSSRVTDIFALKAIEELSSGLVEVTDDPYNTELREKTMFASLYAGLAFSNAGLGLIHAMAHSIGGLLDISHGVSSMLVAGPAIKYNYAFCPEKYRKISAAMGIDESRLKDAELKETLINAIYDVAGEYTEKIISEFRPERDLEETIVKRTGNDPCIATNPGIPNEDELGEIWREISGIQTPEYN
jgi:alcohol dehydrogenase class IV